MAQITLRLSEDSASALRRALLETAEQMDNGVFGAFAKSPLKAIYEDLCLAIAVRAMDRREKAEARARKSA